MFDFLQWLKLKQDQPPGTLEYAGTPRDFTPSIISRVYDADTLDEGLLDTGEPLSSEPGKINYHTVVGIHDADLVKRLGEELEFPTIALEDVMHTGQRAKFTWLDDDTAFLVAPDLRFEGDRITTEQVSLFWRENLVVVFLETDNDLLDGVAARIRKAKGRIRTHGGAYLVGAILDALVDRQMEVLARIGEVSIELEENLVRKVTEDGLSRIYELRREVILMTSQVTPMREIFRTILREDAEVPEQTLPYLRDTDGHFEQVVDGVNALHGILTSMIDYQVSIIGMQTNRVMQFLTVIATIFIPLTFIAGIYGMNFEYMPELKWRYGYFISLGVMGAVGVVMVIYFIRRRFL